MKSRETLIRLKKFQVDEKRRKVAQIEAMIGEFERIATELDAFLAQGKKEATNLGDGYRNLAQILKGGSTES